jgi:MFS family permease
VIVLVFFTTYVVFQPPSTVLVRWLGPRIHLGGITFLWGVVMIGMDFTKKWDQLAALRVVLGLFEAGFFQSCVYLLSTWYTRCMWLARLSSWGFLYLEFSLTSVMTSQTRWASVMDYSTPLEQLLAPWLASWHTG